MRPKRRLQRVRIEALKNVAQAGVRRRAAQRQTERLIQALAVNANEFMHLPVRIGPRYHAEDREEGVFAGGVQRLLENVLKTLTATSVMSLSATVLLGVVSALIMYLGARRILSGAMSLGTYVEYVAFLAMLIAPVSSETITAIASVSSVIPMPARCLVPICVESTGFIDSGRKQAAAASRSFCMITAPSCSGALGAGPFPAKVQKGPSTSKTMTACGLDLRPSFKRMRA